MANLFQENHFNLIYVSKGKLSNLLTIVFLLLTEEKSSCMSIDYSRPLIYYSSIADRFPIDFIIFYSTSFFYAIIIGAPLLLFA